MKRREFVKGSLVVAGSVAVPVVYANESKIPEPIEEKPAQPFCTHEDTSYFLHLKNNTSRNLNYFVEVNPGIITSILPAGWIIHCNSFFKINSSPYFDAIKHVIDSFSGYNSFDVSDFYHAGNQAFPVSIRPYEDISIGFEFEVECDRSGYGLPLITHERPSIMARLINGIGQYDNAETMVAMQWFGKRTCEIKGV